MSSCLSTRRVLSLAALGLLILAGTGARAVGAASAAPAAFALVKTAPAHILVNAQGMALYLFTLDKHNKSVCTGECAEYWPPALVPKGTTVAPALAGIRGTFGVSTRAGGQRQLTYDGAPLYTFVEDKKPGEMTGQGAQGGTWWVVVVDTASAVPGASAPPASTSAPTPTPVPSSGGYGGYGGY